VLVSTHDASQPAMLIILPISHVFVEEYQDLAAPTGQLSYERLGHPFTARVVCHSAGGKLASVQPLSDCTSRTRSSEVHPGGGTPGPREPSDCTAAATSRTSSFF
jgi:hypothetical protein